MTVAQALSLHPHSRWVLIAYHLGKCLDCVSADEETLQEASSEAGFPVERLLADLNSLIDGAEG
jgi:hypothetical protein